MKSFLKFTVAFVVVLLLSASLAPILYVWLPKFLGLFGFDKIYKFERIFARVVMIGTLLAVVLFVRIRKDTLARFGLAWNSQSSGLLLKGAVTGILVLAAVAALRVFSGYTLLDTQPFSMPVWIAKLTGALATGLLIGVMEEFFFRGFIFRSLMRAFKSRAFLSILVTTVFYSIIHFIGLKKVFVGPDPNFIDSIRLMGAPFLSLAEWPKFWPQAVGLFLFGLALNVAAWRSGSLYFSIGLHAGSVFFVRADDFFMRFNGEQTLFWGTKILYDGVLGWLFLGTLAVFLWFILKPPAVNVSGRSVALTER